MELLIGDGLPRTSSNAVFVVLIPRSTEPLLAELVPVGYSDGQRFRPFGGVEVVGVAVRSESGIGVGNTTIDLICVVDSLINC